MNSTPSSDEDDSAVIEATLSHERDSVRWSGAMAPSLSRAQMEMCATSADWHLRDGAGMNVNLPDDLGDLLLSDPVIDVRRAVALNSKWSAGDRPWIKAGWRPRATAALRGVLPDEVVAVGSLEAFALLGAIGLSPAEAWWDMSG